MKKFYQDMAEDIKGIMESDDSTEDDIDLYIQALSNEENEYNDDP